jgi:hypothetical protein
LHLGTSLPGAEPILIAQNARTGSVPLFHSTHTGPEKLINEAARDQVIRNLDDTETW